MSNEMPSCHSRRGFLSGAIAIAGCLFGENLPELFADVPEKGAAPLVISKPVGIVEAPTNLGLRPPSPGKQPGVRRLAETLEADGLADAVGAVSRVRVEPPAYENISYPGEGVRNAKVIYDYSLKLAEAVGKVLSAGQFPLVLGGDCSILLGDLLALRRRGCYGLVYLDAHSDTDFPTAHHHTSGAGSDVTVATGYGTSVLANLEGMKPLVRDDDTIVFGYLEYLPIQGARIHRTPLEQVRKNGIGKEAAAALDLFRSHQVDGFWIHLDADVLNDTIMSAVDSWHPDGMSWDELRETLRAFLSSPMVAGMEVTIYDPDLDPTGRMGRNFADTIGRAFRRAD